jgi:hypothetical protein
MRSKLRPSVDDLLNEDEAREPEKEDPEMTTESADKAKSGKVKKSF